MLSTLLFALVTVGLSQTTCDSITNRILMVGDSWSNFPVGFGSFEKNLDRFGFTNVGMFSNTSDLSVNGAETHDFLTPTGKAAIQNALIANPTIEIVNLSIGGNDILNTWDNSMDSLTTDSLLNATMNRVDSIIMFIESVKPGIKIYLSGYDFANFGEVIQTFTAPTFHPFYSRWDGMGQPSFTEINTLLTTASNKYATLANSYFHATYKSPIGLMQYLYGQTTALGVPPSGTYAPRTVTFPGGRLDYPSPKTRMNNYTVFRDCFHLDAEGYDMLYKYYFEEYYFDYLRGDVDVSISSEGNMKDGGVYSNATISSGNVTMGNNSGVVSKGMVSFNTSSVSSSTLHRADIFLYRNNQTGILPAFNKVFLEIKSGNFGTSSSVDFGDYNSPADNGDTACVYGSVSENGYWLRIRVPSTLLSSINTSGTTQFRISMIDSTDGNTLFFSTGDSTEKPFMDVEYFNPANLVENRNNELPFLFPNPTNNEVVFINNLHNFNGTVRAIDVTGRQIPLEYNNREINVSTLQTGSYILILKDTETKYTLKFVKL